MLFTPLPTYGDMSGQGRRSLVTAKPILRKPDDAALGPRRKRPARILETPALLRLDEGEPLAFRTTRSISPTGVLEAEQEGGDGFRKQPIAIGPDARFSHRSSRFGRSSASPSS